MSAQSISVGERGTFGNRHELNPVPLTLMGPAPLVSALLSSYNYCRYIEATLQSLERQHHLDFEVSICDDGSSDDSVNRISRFCARDARFNHLTQVDSGHAAAIQHVQQGAVRSVRERVHHPFEVRQP